MAIWNYSIEGMVERVERTMVSTNSGHFTHFPSAPFSPGSTRSIFYRITGIVASAPAAPRRSPLNVAAAPRSSASLSVRAEHHSTRIKYWLRFWFIVIAGGNGAKVRWNGLEGEALSERAREGGEKGIEWMGEAQTGRFSRGRLGGGGVSKPTVEEESHSRAAFARWQMHLPKRCGRFWLVPRRHAACCYYRTFLFNVAARTSYTINT